MGEPGENKSWLNRTVLGVGLTSLFSDWSHETATAVLPAFLASIGAGPAWLGAIASVVLSVEDARALFAQFHARVTGGEPEELAEPLAALRAAGPWVRPYPEHPCFDLRPARRSSRPDH